jgi:hypothetical protein
MEPRQFIPFWLAVIATLALGGCGGGLAGVASFGTEVVARGITGKIDNDGGLFGQDTSTINYTPAQNAQRAANNAAVPPRNDKGVPSSSRVVEVQVDTIPQVMVAIMLLGGLVAMVMGLLILLIMAGDGK